jgi:anti-anti-sigma factor
MIEIENSSASTITCRPWGDLDLAASIHFRHVIAGVVRPRVDLVIDLGHVGSIDAVGVSALVGTVRRVRAFGGAVSIRNANARVRWLLGLLGVDQLVVPIPMAGSERDEGVEGAQEATS